MNIYRYVSRLVRVCATTQKRGEIGGLAVILSLLEAHAHTATNILTPSKTKGELK